MKNSLKDLFEISEVLDIKQEMIAKILMHTSDQDNNPADEPFIELARKLEEEEISVREAQEALDAMTKGEVEEIGVAGKVIGTDGSVDGIQTFDNTKDMKDFARANRNVKDVKPLEEVIDDEGRMAKHDLLKLTQYSAKLYKSLGDNDQLPGWIQAKITLAADYIGTVKHYLEGEQVMGGEEAPSGQLEEAAGDVEYYHWEDLHLDIFLNKPVEDIPSAIYLPLAADAKKQMNTGNYKKMLELSDDYQSKYGTKEDLVERERGYLEREFYQWKDGFEGFEGDEECVVSFDKGSASVKVDEIKKMADKYSAGKAKGDTSDVYESSIMKILSK